MNKTINTVLIIVLSMLIMTSNVTNSRSLGINGLDYPTGINMLVFADASEPLFISYNGLISNYTEADNTISVVNNGIWDFASDDLSGYDALFVSISGLQIFDNVENPEVVAIKNWFDSGNKLLWVGGNDDFAGTWLANRTNPLLEAIGTPLRFDAGAVNDPVSNDAGGLYRVMANRTGVSSSLVNNVTIGFENMLFHGPTSINYHDGAKITDLRNMTLPASIDIVINSSQYAVVIDTDYSQGDDDYYAYIESSNTTYQPINGFLPMLVVDRKASVSNSMIVLSGERVYSDYKNMYGNTWERQPELVHQGSLIVDNLLNYYFVTSGEFNDTTTTPTITAISTTTSPDITDFTTITTTTSPEITDFTIISTTTGSVVTAIDSDEGPDTIDSVVSLPLPIISFFVAIILLGIGNLLRGKLILN